MSWGVWQDMECEVDLAHVEKQKDLVPRVLGRFKGPGSSIRVGGRGGKNLGGMAAASVASATGRLLLRLRRPASAAAASSAAASSAPASLALVAAGSAITCPAARVPAVGGGYHMYKDRPR
jgi:hypothetical protein